MLELPNGVFIHWGIYSVPAYCPIVKTNIKNGSEWYLGRYKKGFFIWQGN